MTRWAALLIIGLCATASLIAAQESAQPHQTLPEMLRERKEQGKGILEGITLVEYSPDLTLEVLAGYSDLIARVRIVERLVHLTKNQDSVESDHTVQVVDRFLSRLEVGSKPSEIVVNKPGGTMMIEGYEYTHRVNGFPPFDVGDEYILFLIRDQRGTGRYVVVAGQQGAFKIMGQTIEQVAGASFVSEENRRGRVPLDKFLSELRSAIRKERSTAFKNVIRAEGECGVGLVGYLINSDTTARYRVTVRDHWADDYQSGQTDQIYISGPGSRQELGCSVTGPGPNSMVHTREVVGEAKLPATKKMGLGAPDRR